MAKSLEELIDEIFDEEDPDNGLLELYEKKPANWSAKEGFTGTWGICECGKEKLNLARHLWWCPKYDPEVDGGGGF